ncbi:MAG TPA: bifunctional diaminohydroxyphosphoribosylaminopyrimidine deaminase/5-amino-6-(5-phosphoribosylamino)uracil reductase RibD [Candidatus Cloacimonadota bacterium]|nr:bifunctional diaminohydroxyphosphoribosylaminopyrimidine deaminase/5-amino-6-(5-phosphoribosylamino)uracil reductase RibD [Candidatus Cloacimonadota bacterium]
MPYQEKYFKLAYELAEKGRGRTSPNPFVGAVLVRDGKVIGKGYTQPYGKDHAEVQAVKAAKSQCMGADLYVTLEPCSHYGNTPPCADMIIEQGIKSVYIGIEDPNPIVSGRGINKLQDAGIEVTSGIWKDKIFKQLEAYITYITEKRPYVFIKNAVTLDGKIADKTGNSRWISGEESRLFVHQLRQEADAVITGIGTVLADDPMLNVRLPEAYKQPLRVVLDHDLQISLHSNLVKTAKEFQTLIFKAEGYDNPSKEEKLQKAGVKVEAVSAYSRELDLHQVLNILYGMKKMQVMVEAGTELSSSFQKNRLVDKLYYFISPKIVGGKRILYDNVGVDKLADALEFNIDEVRMVGRDLLLIAYPMK